MRATNAMYRAAAIVAAGPHNWEMCGESEREYYAKEVKPIVDAALEAAAPPDDARTVYQWKSQLANWMSDYTIQSNLKNIHHPGDRANVAWFLACKLTGTPVTGLDSGGDNSPDDDAVTRVLEAAEKASYILGLMTYSMPDGNDVVSRTRDELQAAVSALRDREGR